VVVGKTIGDVRRRVVEGPRWGHGRDMMPDLEKA
jgi:hypothetical protein